MIALTVFLLVPAAPAFAVNDPVAYWKFDGDALDHSSGGTNDGTLQGGPVYVPGGKYDQALNFDGSGQYVNVGSDSSLQISSAITFAGWVRIDSTGETQRLLGAYAAGDYTFELAYSGGSYYPRFVIFSGPTCCVGSTPVPLDTWTHVAITFDDAADKVQLYTNGTLNNEGAFGAQITSTATTREISSGAFEFSGTIDEVRIYNRALSAEEIQALYSARCLDPVGAEAEIIYNTTANVPQVCNGKEWMSMGAINPAAGGSGCSNPTGDEGELMYNGDYHVVQYCDGDDWIATHGYEIPFTGDDGDILCPAPTLCPNVGDVCDDSNAGNNPDPKFAGFVIYANATCGPLYVTQDEQSTGSAWRSSGSGDNIATDSWEDGQLNQPSGGTFPAFDDCYNLTYGGYDDWYLPALGEMTRLYQYRSIIGGFNNTAYWSSTEVDSGDALTVEFDDGQITDDPKTTSYDVRCVRRD